MTTNMDRFKEAIAEYPDFPQKGILFRDISPLLANTQLREEAYDLMAKHYIDSKIQIDAVAGIDSRGFIFGTALAARLKVPFVMIRKPSKLPGKIHSIDYGLEYGKNTLTLQHDAIRDNHKVLVVDDLLATGGSADAAIQLIKKAGGTVVGACFAIELDGLDGAKKLSPVPVFSLMHFSVSEPFHKDASSTTAAASTTKAEKKPEESQVRS